MRLYNKCGRAFIIHKDDAVSGCRFPKDDMTKTRAYIDPETEVEVKDKKGEELLGMYPTELKRMDQKRAKKVKAAKGA